MNHLWQNMLRDIHYFVLQAIQPELNYFDLSLKCHIGIFYRKYEAPLSKHTIEKQILNNIWLHGHSGDLYHSL